MHSFLGFPSKWILYGAYSYSRIYKIGLKAEFKLLAFSAVTANM